MRPSPGRLPQALAPEATREKARPVANLARQARVGPGPAVPDFADPAIALCRPICVKVSPASLGQVVPGLVDRAPVGRALVLLPIRHADRGAGAPVEWDVLVDPRAPVVPEQVLDQEAVPIGNTWSSSTRKCMHS